MKKITILFLLCVAAIIGAIYWFYEYSSIDGRNQIETIRYNGHSYICYKWQVWPITKGSGASLLHDPDCACQINRHTTETIRDTVIIHERIPSEI